MAAFSMEIPELQMFGVFDASIPNRERIVLRPVIPLSLNSYGVAVGLPALPVGAFPLFDNCFWFPQMDVEPPAWIVIYTGPGKNKTSSIGGTTTLSFHWQRPFTLFGANNLVPILFRLDSAAIGKIIQSQQGLK